MTIRTELTAALMSLQALTNSMHKLNMEFFYELSRRSFCKLPVIFIVLSFV